MSDNVEAKVRSLFDQAKPPDPPPEKSKRPATLIPYLLAGLATLILIFQTITIAAPEPEPPRYQEIYSKVPSVDQTIQPAAYHPPNTEIDIHCVGCAHVWTRPMVENAV